MFSRAFSFWHPSTGESPESEAAPTAVADDRRLWIRIATDLTCAVQLGSKPGNDRILARLRDVSLAGANLIVDRRVEPGQMLSLEFLPPSDDVRTALACVVRAVAQSDGTWALGCVFARELGSDDLAAFGASKIPAPSDDKRTWLRFPCHVQARIRPFGTCPGDAQSVQVLNISASGVGFRSSAPLEAGALLNVDLFDRNGRKVCAILACVVHVSQKADGEQEVGCNFIRELNDDEMETLLQE
jgi:PilZ domain